VKDRIKIILFLVVFLSLIIGLPILGVYLAGKPVARYLEFPPLTHYVEHAEFSWIAFILLAVFIIAVISPFIIKVLASQHISSCPDIVPVLPNTDTPVFPWWGWIGLVANIAAWILAWNRFKWFSTCQQFTFSPLWFSYILVVNALTFRISGKCMMTHRSRFFLWLFPVSAVFWWFFEYLNRFVQNWYYVGIGNLTSWQYFVFATLPFSTVLPAVLGTAELLACFPKTTAGLESFVRINVQRTATFAWVGLIVASIGLAGIGIWPDYLFPLLWVSPLLVVACLQAIAGEETIFSGIRRGDWRDVFRMALAALICGFFWEMWNIKSQAKWIYTVPFVNRFKIFEMSILGYAGYLPFGLECAAIGAIVQRLVGCADSAGLSHANVMKRVSILVTMFITLCFGE